MFNRVSDFEWAQRYRESRWDMMELERNPESGFVCGPERKELRESVASIRAHTEELIAHHHHRRVAVLRAILEFDDEEEES